MLTMFIVFLFRNLKVCVCAHSWTLAKARDCSLALVLWGLVLAAKSGQSLTHQNAMSQMHALASFDGTNGLVG